MKKGVFTVDKVDNRKKKRIKSSKSCKKVGKIVIKTSIYPQTFVLLRKKYKVIHSYPQCIMAKCVHKILTNVAEVDIDLRARVLQGGGLQVFPFFLCVLDEALPHAK